MNRISYVVTFLCLGISAYAQDLAGDTTLNRTIDEVEVIGKYASGISGGPLRTLQVERQLSAVSVTAAEAIRQLPSIVTDIEGGVTFRGSNKSGLFINGIPYGLMEEYSGDVLIQLPALFFNKVGLQVYPDITWVPDGDAGVLNLSSSAFPSSERVSPLSLSLGAGWHERYNAGTVLNLNPGRFHINAKYNYRKEFRSRTFSKTTTTKQNTTVMNNNADARPDVHLAELRLGYDISENDQIGVSGLFYVMDYSRYGRINNQVFNLQGDRMKYVIRNRYNDQYQSAWSADTYWKHQFQQGSHLSALFHYNNFKYDEDNDYKNENPNNQQIIAEDNQFINHDKHNYFWKLNYVYPFGENYSFQAGYIGRLTNESHRNEVNAKQNGEWSPTLAKNYDYSFQRYLNLLFLSFGKKTTSWNAEVGLQAEFTNRKINETLPSATNLQETKAHWFHVYPRALVAYTFHPRHTLQLTYQQRVIRPLGSELSSFIDNTDITHVIVGNPSLHDEYIHTLELNWQWVLSNFRMTPAIYYRNRQNRIVEIATQQEEETLWQKCNSGTSQTFGADLSLRWQPLRLLDLGFAGDIFRDEIDGRTIGYDIRKSLWCWDVKGNVSIHITPSTELQIDGFYISDQLTVQGKIKSHYTVNVGLSQYFAKRKWCAQISVNNLFDSLEETTLIDSDQLQLTQKRNRDPRVAWLTLTYTL